MNGTKRTTSVIVRRDWAKQYATKLFYTDVVIVFAAVFGSQLFWFGTSESLVTIDDRLDYVPLTYTVVSLSISLLWLAFLSGSGSRDRRVVGTGTSEYRNVVNSSVMLFGLLAIGAFLLKIELARGYFATALPAGLFALVIARWGWRQYLSAQRRKGNYSARVILVGSVASTSIIARDLMRQPEAGYLVIGAFVSDAAGAEFLPSALVPVLGDVEDLFGDLSISPADTIIVASSDELPPERLRKLSWLLEPGRKHLVVAPGLIDIAGPRMHTRPVAGLPLIHVETPRYEGSKRTVKRLFDIVSSGFLVGVLFAPLAVVAMAVRLGSPGSIWFKQERVGLNGRSFKMYKFRTMVRDAESLLPELSAGVRRAGNQVMFKMTDDPRVTPIGRFLRRFSIDELPQLLNVLRGEMSLVGPRPPLASEVEQYDEHVNRRFLVKPGITGLWQVSGRSNLDWEMTVRLDLFYVENWTLTGDLLILWRTARAVLSRDGAY